MSMTPNEKFNAYHERLRAQGGKRTSLDLSAEALKDLETIRARGKFTSTREIVAAALKKLAHG